MATVMAAAAEWTKERDQLIRERDEWKALAEKEGAIANMFREYPTRLAAAALWLREADQLRAALQEALDGLARGNYYVDLRDEINKVKRALERKP